MFPRVKICCISSIAEAEIAIAHGAHAIGLVGPMPSGPGIINLEEISHIRKSIPPHIDTFLLSSEITAEGIINQYEQTKTSTIQLVDKMMPGSYRVIRKKLPKVKLVQVIHVINEDSIFEAKEISDYVDALLLDSGNPNALIKILGGTGKKHNWSISQQIVKAVKMPVYLAGGINAENVVEAFNTVKPYGIDLCSGVRTHKKLDPKKIELFFKNVKSIR